jgi:DnaJ-class molecular chaperone
LGFMTVQRSFEVLELSDNATLDDARQAYRDIANVWHPDRFNGNPRLRWKAEQKLKEINLAYETAKAFLQEKGQARGASTETAHDPHGTSENANFKGTPTSKKGTSRTETAAEMGTVFVLSVYSFVSDKLHRFLEKGKP